MTRLLHRTLDRGLVIAALVGLLGLPSAAQADSTPFTFVALPDTQGYSEAFPNIFTSQTQWIVNNRTSQNIAFVAHQGDLTDNDEATQWSRATTSMYILDSTSPRLPWGTCKGNHDVATSYDAYFGPSHFAGQSWYGDSYGSSSYQKFQAGGRTYLVLDIQNNAYATVRNWAKGIITANPGMPTIVNTHEYLTLGVRTEYGETLWNDLIKPNAQVFAVMCGHIYGEYNQTSINDAGKPVFELLADYQYDTHYGDGYLRQYEFDEANSAIHVKSYSPYLNAYRTDALNQFDLSMNFNARLGAVPEPSTCIQAVIGLFCLAAMAVGSQRGRRFCGVMDRAISVK